MKKIKIILMALILASCHLFEPVDKNTMQRVQTKPSEKEIIDKWSLDNFSYEFLNDSRNPKDINTILILKEKNEFEIVDFPIIDELNFIGSKNFTGSWGIQKSVNKKYWELKLEVVTDNNQKRSLIFDIYNKNTDGLVFWKFIGDPDAGNRFMFMKKKK